MPVYSFHCWIDFFHNRLMLLDKTLLTDTETWWTFQMSRIIRLHSDTMETHPQRPGTSHQSSEICSISMHHSIQIVFSLLLGTTHLYCKAIVLGDLYKGVASYWHYNDVIMITIASQITSLAVVYSTVYSDADQRKHQSSASLAFVWGIHRDRWIPRTKGLLRGKCFYLMTSSWFTFELIFGELDLASSDKSNTRDCCA